MLNILLKRGILIALPRRWNLQSIGNLIQTRTQFSADFFFFLTCELTNGRKINLSWCCVAKLRLFVFGNLFLCFKFFQFETEEQKHGDKYSVETIDEFNKIVEKMKTRESVAYILMGKNVFPPLKPKAICRSGKLYNYLVDFVWKKNFGVQAWHFAEYCELVTLFASVNWNIDPHYHELQSQGKIFLLLLKIYFLGLKNLNYMATLFSNYYQFPLLQKLKSIDRVFMTSIHMKSFLWYHCFCSRQYCVMLRLHIWVEWKSKKELSAMQFNWTICWRL